MPDQPFSADGPLPEGVRDLLFADAAAWRGIESALRETWTAWGYREIILPTFEYAATLATDVGAEIDAEMYRFSDRHGRTLALRPDMTIPTARVVATRLFDQAMPLRLSYVGSVYRYEPPRAGRQHEFTQAGIELIGAPGSAADAEVVGLAVAALRAANVPQFRITIGHVGFFNGLVTALALPDRLAARLREAVDRKSEAEIAALISQASGLPSIARNATMALLRLSGPAGILKEAEGFCLNAAMLAAIVELQSLAELLAAYGVADAVSYDLAEVRDLGYYTGITFEGFAPGLGFPLVSGGRYDNLIGHFGPPKPAVGWALTVDRVILARELQGITHAEPPPDVLLSARGCPGCMSWAAAARGRGLRVEVDLLDLTAGDLWSAAKARGIPRAVLHHNPERLTVRDAGGESEIAPDDWEEVERWPSR